MYQCEQNEVPCLNTEYKYFDDISRKEVIAAATVNEIMNESLFASFIAVDMINEHTEDMLSVHDELLSLKEKVGIYHLYIYDTHCQDHDVYSLQCVYVGKGLAINRIKSHIKEKWPESELLYISFYECKNRIAKYYEQLFLDTYKFHLNDSENSGDKYLFARWSHERFTLGTETHALAARAVEKGLYPEDDFE